MAGSTALLAEPRLERTRLRAVRRHDRRKSADASASVLIRNHKVAERISELQNRVSEQLLVEAVRLGKELGLGDLTPLLAATKH